MFKIFKSFPQLKYGMSDKSHGPMEQGNYQVFLKSINISPRAIISCQQVHSSNLVKVTTKDAGTTVPATDGLITGDSGIFLTITIADCFPVYFFDSQQNLAALAHCGWRGITADLVTKIIQAINSEAKNLLVGIGPGIQACHFEVKEDILNKFSNYPESIIHSDGKIFIDLPKIISQQLNTAGVLKQNIENLRGCTYCLNKKYLSFRRDKPKKVQAMLAYMGIDK